MNRTPAKVFGPFRTSCPHHHCAGATVPRPCRADLASGLAGTLYEYTSILREPGGDPLPADAGPFPLSGGHIWIPWLRDNIGCCRSWGGARGRWGPASWSVAAAFDRQGKAIGCEPPARDERVCPPGGEPSRVYGYRSFCPLGSRDGFACGDPLHRWGQRFVHLASRRLCGLYGPMLCTLHFRT